MWAIPSLNSFSLAIFFFFYYPKLERATQNAVRTSVLTNYVPNNGNLFQNQWPTKKSEFYFYLFNLHVLKKMVLVVHWSIVTTEIKLGGDWLVHLYYNESQRRIE